MLLKKPLVEHFDDISQIHQEVPGYTHCIRVDFVEPMPECDDPDNPTADEIQAYYEQTAMIVVFGDLAPEDIICDWRDNMELWFRYNIGSSVPTLSPPATIEERRHLLALCDAAEILDVLNTKELAEYLEHFDGYPKDDNGIAACERETLISNEGDQANDENFMVWLAGCLEPFFFKTEDEAYIFVIANYGVLQLMHGIEV